MKVTEMLADTLKQAKDKKWPYPKTFQILKEAGVQTYKVTWGEKYEGIYHGTFGEWLEPAPSGYIPVKKRGATFSKQKVQEILQRHQRGETTFITVLAGIGRSRRLTLRGRYG